MRRIVATFILISMIFLVGCASDKPQFHLPSNGGAGGYVPSVPPRLTDEESKIAVFANGAPDGFWARNDRGNGDPFNCAFSNANAVVKDGVLTLSLVNTKNGYAGAEYRTYPTASQIPSPPIRRSRYPSSRTRSRDRAKPTRTPPKVRTQRAKDRSHRKA